MKSKKHKKERRIKVGYSMPEESIIKIEKFIKENQLSQSELLEHVIKEHLKNNF